MSATYYAVFHDLTDRAVRHLIGSAPDSARNHIDPDLVEALHLFGELQAARHRADDDHDAPFEKLTLLNACEDATRARTQLTSASATSREALFTFLTMRRSDFRER